jgi:hypothetical protein
MIPLILIYPHDHILEDVKQESSLLAVRKRDRQGFSVDVDDNSYFDLLVFDEDYFIKFRELFFDAQAEVIHVLSTCTRDVPAEGAYVDEKDFSRNRNFRLALLMPDEWNVHLSKALDSKVREFLIAYIMYRWLETKLPDEAATFLVRANAAKSAIKRMAGDGVRRRWHGYW